MLKLKGFLTKEKGEIVGIASTETADRHGEKIKQDGWDLKDFKKNPVIMASHQYQDFPIGKATRIAVKEKKLVFKMLFSEASQKAKEASQLVQEGILNCFSVGFVPKEYDKKNENIITKAELLEISLVSVPANPQAVVVAKGMKNDLVQSMVKHWLLDEDLKKQVDELTTSEDGNVKDTEKKVEGRNPDDDLKILQKVTGHLQELCRRAKTGGAKK